jgi:ribosomal protein S18 acetylase RimI-like enzyme
LRGAIQGTATPTFSLRAAVDADRDFLAAVYASTRQDELALVSWSEAKKREYLELQCRLQETQYQSRYAGASFDVVMSRGEGVGRLYVDRSTPKIHIIDIALLLAHRGSGLGTAILSDVLREADAAGRAVTLSVEGRNRARSLYERLGFCPFEDTGVYVRMERVPGSAVS